MSKKSDDSIERIFRQALTQYDTTFQQSDWLKMEKMLDEEVVRRGLVRSRRIKGIGFALTGLTVLFIAVYFLAFNPSDSAARLNRPALEMQAGDDLHGKGNVKLENSSDGLLSSGDSSASTRKDVGGSVADNADVKAPAISQSGSTTPSAEKVEQSQAGSSLSSKEKKSTREANDQDALFTKKSVIKNKVAQGEQPQKPAIKSTSANDLSHAPIQDLNESNESISENDNAPRSQQSQDLTPAEKQDQSVNKVVVRDIIPPPVANNNKTVEENKEKISDNDGSISSETVGLSKDSALQMVSNNPSLSPPVLVEEAHTVNKSVETVVQNDSLPKVDTDSLAKQVNVAAVVVQDSVTDDSEKKKQKPASRFSIGIVFAPEFSTTRLNHYSTPGQSIGLRIGYQISNRFHINAGLIRSTKKYKDSAAEYSPNPNYWNNRTNGVIPEEIDGQCVVYEIPLDIQFNLVESAKSRLFISTGIASYLMTSQAYHYDFEQPNPGADTSWETSRTEKYWFGVGMVSAGYERYISRALALGIEPYLKTSLTEIGWPNVKLFSAGAYVTLRYRFMTKNP